MNVAITCDSLIERNHPNEIIELLCEAFPDSMIYTLAHKEKAILGTIEQRKIKSSGLSRKITKEDELFDHLLMLPNLTSSMKLSCQHDFILNVSRGFSHAFDVCEKSVQITYLYELGFEVEFNSFWKRLLRPYVIRKFMSAFKNSKRILVSSEKLQARLKDYGIDSTVLLPPFKLSDYALFPKTMFKHDYYTIDTRGLTLEKLKEIASFFLDKKERFQFVGPMDEAVQNEIKKMSAENIVFGERCSGEHAPVLASSRAFISFNQEKFPKMSLAALAVGRPAVMLDIHKDLVSGVGTYFIAGFDTTSLALIIDQINNEHESLDSQKIRANVMKFHDVKFKSQLKRILDKEMGQETDLADAADINL